ncbi:DUF2721 domain-containing protein [Sphingomonas sanxanigenens]|nr:DUF2721 domain-containing protein [Sphingomonas sanxanigenens]
MARAAVMLDPVIEHRHPCAMLSGPAVTDIAHTIQLAVAPVFLLAGIGGILNVLAGRLQRVVDRSRFLATLHGESTGAEHERHVWELRLIDRRIKVVSASIALSVASAIAVCLLVALLFVASLAQLRAAVPVAILFVLAMMLLTAGLVSFAYEVRLAIINVRVPRELLEKDT